MKTMNGMKYCIYNEEKIPDVIPNGTKRKRIPTTTLIQNTITIQNNNTKQTYNDDDDYNSDCDSIYKTFLGNDYRNVHQKKRNKLQQ